MTREKRILFVDDDENILAAYRRRLRKRFHIQTAPSGEHGLALVTQSETPFEVIISDLKMPDMDGFEFLKKVNSLSPSTIAIMLTGHAELQSSLRAFNEGYIFRFLTKPCKIDVLEQAILAGLEAYQRNVKIATANQANGSPHHIRRILVVDSDHEMLAQLSSALKELSGISVLTADNCTIAFKLFHIFKFDALVTATVLPEMDGITFVRKMLSAYPEIQVHVMAWCVTEKIRKQSGNTRQIHFYERPVSIMSMIENISDALYSGPKGIIDGISLSGFLQIIEMEEKTCTLRVSAHTETGLMYFMKGALCNAETSDKSGEAAALSIINWDKPAIEIENYCHKTEKIIQSSLMNVLMEAARLKDESCP